jgi:hypothetical protein
MPELATFEVHTCSTGLGLIYWVKCQAPAVNTCSLGPIAAWDPRARLLVTQRWSAASAVFNPHNVGVYYTGGGWRVFNEDGAAMPNNVEFNVAVISVLLADDFESADLECWTLSPP